MAETSFEVKFGQLSDARIHEKAPVLAPHKIGFQLVDKNDDESRAVGVMAYRLGKQWVYVPCFWLAGKLKGQDLLYLKQQDVFVPLNEAWVNYLKTRQPLQIGEGLDKSKDDEGGGGAGVRVEDSSVLGLRKSAGDLSLIGEDDLGRMLEAPTVEGFSLTEWLPRMGKEAAVVMINTLRKNADFAGCLAEHYDPEDLFSMASFLKDEPVEKRAASIKIITDPRSKEAAELDDKAKELLLKDGAYVVDDRETTSDVFRETVDSETLETPTKTGVYDVLLADGTYRGFGVIIPRKLVKRRPGNLRFELPRDEMFVVDLKKNPTTCVRVASDEIMAKIPPKTRDERAETIGELGGPLRLTEMLDAGEVLVVDRAGDAVKVNFPRKITNEGTDLRFHVSGLNREMCVKLTGKDGKLHIVDDTVYVPSNARMVKLDHSHHSDEGTPAFGSPQTVLNKMVKQADDVELVKLYHDGARYQITTPTGDSGAIDKIAVLRELTGRHNVSAQDAKSMLRDVDVRPGMGGASKRYFVKLAYDEFGIDGDEAGDDMSQSERSITTATLDGPSVREVMTAANSGVKEVLDVTVISTLARKSRALEIVDDYMSDLMKSLDRVGRLLFLFYWHNDDFQNRYGSQEMYDLEISLRDVFDSISDLVLFLREKTTSSSDAFEDVEGDLSDNLGNA